MTCQPGHGLALSVNRRRWDELGQTPVIDSYFPLVNRIEGAVSPTNRRHGLNEAIKGPAESNEVRQVRRAARLPGDDVVDVAAVQRRDAPPDRTHAVPQPDRRPQRPRCQLLRAGANHPSRNQAFLSDSVFGGCTVHAGGVSRPDTSSFSASSEVFWTMPWVWWVGA